MRRDAASPTCTGRPRAEPDAHFELTARAAEIRLSSGRIVHALTYNGTSPGPELRVRQGDLVEVVLRNDDVDRGRDHPLARRRRSER